MDWIALNQDSQSIYLTTIKNNLYKNMEAYKIINKIIEESKSPVKYYEEFTFDHHGTIKRINFYINNKFLTRDDGVFWNISNQRSAHFAKNIELDTKDLLPYGEGETNMLQSWTLRKAIRQWAEKKKLALELNDLAENTSDYGSSVVKVVDGKMELVDLRNLYFNPLVKDIRDSDIVEKHFLTPNEIREKADVWDNVDELLEKDHEGRYEINEFFGYFKNDDEEGFKRIIQWGEGDDEIILWEEDVKQEDNPYYDFHLTKYEGRWLRVGVVERLFDLQERANELVNQNAQATEIASLLLFRTANQDVVGNILEGALNGQIINDETLQQIGITNTGLNQFISELREIEMKANELCLTPDVIRGEALPSGTPFRSMAALTNAARSAFKMLRENIGERIAYILKELILPEVVKGFNRGVLLDIAEDEKDIEMFDDALKKKAKLKALLDGSVINPYLVEQIEMAVEERGNKHGRKLEIPKGWFNFKWGIKFNITGEAYDKAQQNATMEGALQMMLGSQGAVNDIPLFKQYLENNGISWWKLTPEQLQALQAQHAEVPQPKEDKLMSQIDTQ